MSFKDISCLELWRPFCLAMQTICAILVDDIMWNNSVKLFEFGPSVHDKMLLKIFLI